MNKKILFLIGSPKLDKESASAAIGMQFIKALHGKSLEFEVDKINIIHLMSKGSCEKILLGAINKSDIIIFISPLYLDTVPASVTKAMEFLSGNKYLMNGRKKMIAISVCGYPEASHNDTALRIYRCFADGMGFTWLGCLAIGEGPAYIYARQIFSLLGVYRRLKKAISLVVQSLLEEKMVPKEAAELAKISAIPNGLYISVGTLIMAILALKDGVWNLYKRPYV